MSKRIPDAHAFPIVKRSAALARQAWPWAYVCPVVNSAFWSFVEAVAQARYACFGNFAWVCEIQPLSDCRNERLVKYIAGLSKKAAREIAVGCGAWEPNVEHPPTDVKEYLDRLDEYEKRGYKVKYDESPPLVERVETMAFLATYQPTILLGRGDRVLPCCVVPPEIHSESGNGSMDLQHQLMRMADISRLALIYEKGKEMCGLTGPATQGQIIEALRERLGGQGARARLYVEDIDNFSKVNEVKPAMVAHLLNKGYFNRLEDDIKRVFGEILDIPFDKPHFGGESNDIYTADVHVNNKRTATAFFLKGRGIKARELQITHCGKNGDQLVKLFESPADLFVVQFVGMVSEAVIKDMDGKVQARRKEGKPGQFLIINGQDTARIFYAYGKLK